MRILIVLALLTLGAVGVSAQVPDSEADIRAILDSLNARRISEQRAPFVPNAELTRAADIVLADIAARPLDNPGDLYRTTDRRNIEAILREQTAFAAYSDGYVADMIVLVLGGVAPADAVNEWNAQQTNPLYASWRMLRGEQQFLPIYESRYREVGIAYQPASEASRGRAYYVMVFGAQPNVLPLAATTERARTAITTTIDSARFFLFIPDERARSLSSQTGVIGRAIAIRVSQEPGLQDCPRDPNNLPRPWRSPVFVDTFTLSSFGEVTYFVQFCDARGTPHQESIVIRYPDPRQVVGGPTATVDIAPIVQATQTAAVQATQFALVQPTVEFVLTATAAAPGG